MLDMVVGIVIGVVVTKLDDKYDLVGKIKRVVKKDASD